MEEDDIGPPRVVAGREEDTLPANAKIVARSFRYMRRKPTIIAYKPPKGKHLHLSFQYFFVSQ